MITSIKNSLLVMLFLILSATLFAQSDYEMVQSFKERHQTIADGIKEAKSLDELNNLNTEVENLRRDFSAKKRILDQSLYPENFNSSLDNLLAGIELRRGDFTEIDVLKTEVVVLKSEVDLLNKRNNELLNQITVLESQRKKDAATIEKLEKLVADLRATIIKRDQLIYSIVDSLTPKLAGDVSAMTQQDKEQVYSQVERNNLLATVKRSLRDNSRFLDVTSLKANDLYKVKEQEQGFVTMWRKIGPKLVEVYASKGDKSAELKEIDNLFNVWSGKIKKEAWESINEEFSLNNINLQNFNSGKEFTDVVTKYISDEIKNYGVKNKVDSEAAYSLFVDSVYFKSVTSEWMPYLLDNNLLTTEQKDIIEKKISEWKSIVSPQDYTLYYALAGVALFVLLIAIISLLKKKKSNNSAPPTVTE